MPEITANIVVEPIQLSVTETTQNLDVVVDSTNLNLYTATGITNPAGNVGELQYHATGNLFGAIANSNVDANGNLVFTNLSNLKIDGGVNAYYLQTDGTGNLTWAAGGTPTGSGVPSGANTQIQLSDGSGSFDSGVGFTFDKATNILNVPGNVDITGIFNGDGGGLSNVTVTTSQIVNGTSNVDIAIADGNITMGVNGVADIVTISSAGLEVTKTTSIQQAIEKATLVASSATGTINFDLLDQAIVYYTLNASSNFTLNIRGNVTNSLNSVMAIGESMTLTFLNTNGSTGYYASAIEIDGTPITPKYSAGYAAIGTANGIDALTLNIIKTAASTFTVLGSKIGFS